jgi:hypothetical protein
MAAASNQLLSLEFTYGSIDCLTASILKMILKNSYIEKLGITCCDLTKGAADILNVGLQQNTSLRELRFVRNSDRLTIDGVLENLNSNTNIRQLTVGPCHESIVPLCDAVHRSAKLQILELCSRTMGQDCVAAIAMMMRNNNNMLKTLTFHLCCFRQSEMALLLTRMSEITNVLDALNFEHVTIERGSAIRHPELNWANLKVENLACESMKMDFDNFSTMMDGIAVNEHIQKLNIFGTLGTDETFQKLCQALLEPDRGPLELCIDQVGSRGAMILNALRHNTTVTRLSLADLDLPGLVLFAEGLAQLNHICSLQIGLPEGTQKYSMAFFAALQQSLEQNTTLLCLELCGIEDYADKAKPFLNKIEYFLAWNCVGRNSFLTADVPLGIWAHVLASEQVSAKKDLAHFFLTNKADVIIPSSWPNVATSRRRKSRNCKQISKTKKRSRRSSS